MKFTTPRIAMLALSLLAAPGCYRGTSTDDSGAGFGSDNSGSGASDTSDDPNDSTPPQSEDLVTPSGIRRLTVAEYDNTVRDLLGDDTRPAASVLAPDPREPFDNDFTVQQASKALIEGTELLAGDIADRLIADATRTSEVVGCEPTGPGDADCFRQFLASFGRRAFRRPFTIEDVDRYAPLLEHGIDEGDFEAAVATAIRAMLQDPEFLYRVEVGVPVDGVDGVFKLTDFEVASRLSYLLWGSTPSDDLLDRAEAGGLTSAGDVEAAALDMLDDPRALEQIARFHAMWIGYESAPLPDNLDDAMRTETQALIERVVFEQERPWQDVFTISETYVDDQLARHYGLNETPPATGGWISYEGTQRAGILSHATFLAIGNKFDDTSPTRRGKRIRERLFCTNIQLPPAEDEVDVDTPPPGEGELCKRERYETVHSTGACAGCHRLMDSIGFGLEQYDGEGRFRDREPDLPQCEIDGEGEVVDVGTFNGPAELGHLLVDSGVLNDCAVSQLHKFVAGRSVFAEEDQAVVDTLSTQIGDGDFEFKLLLLSVVKNDSFLYRRDETP